MLGGLANVVLLYLVGSAFFRRRLAGLVAGFLYGVLTPAIAYDTSVQEPTWLVMGTLAMFLALDRVVDGRMRPVRAVMWIGAVGGIGAYVRSSILIAVLATGFALLPLIGWRRGLAAAAGAMALAYAIFLPWVLRDAVALRHFVPLGRTGTGQVLWEGLGQTPNSHHARADDALTEQDVRSWGVTAPYGSADYDHALLARYVAVAKADPALILRNLADHGRMAWQLLPYGLEPAPIAQGMRLLGQYLPIAAGLGALRHWRRIRRWSGVPLTVLLMSAATLPVLWAQRIWLPILLPAYVLLAAVALVRPRLGLQEVPGRAAGSVLGATGVENETRVVANHRPVEVGMVGGDHDQVL
jgi:hypothetical protein